MNKTIKPGIVIDGKTVYPESWTILLAFAISGCDWAIKAIMDDESKFKEEIKQCRLKATLESQQKTIRIL